VSAAIEVQTRGPKLPVLESLNPSQSPTPRLSTSIRQSGRALLNQQCWLWGQDIKRAEGNLLLQHGFQRLRPAPGQSGSSQYTLQLGDTLHVRLWGFGMYFGREQGIFLNRFECIPRRAELSDLWQAQEMTQLPRAIDLSLLPAALRWITGYEQWVLTTCGASYRSTCLRGWEAAVGTPHLLPTLWQQLAEDVQNALTLKEWEATRRQWQSAHSP
jgi:hypothetical protein